MTKKFYSNSGEVQKEVCGNVCEIYTVYNFRKILKKL